ncbi:hypothetical protein NP233_g7441 [Leucocoprinus birnbaumii]|uniref:Pinin/SDK/MemA protein domain-containing protein n=1 Tax=Leucocoprinus birnbaumii TaxID=56174 RepID=A0AAD5VPD2_9AGAR|nr:hypothetical protein NP233_g7441 [Leucocoprinus birnbaumii]
MSSEDQIQDSVVAEVAEAPKSATETRKRPRLDLSAITGDNRERKRGKSMFGLVLGTLNKAKIEDKERNASEAKRQKRAKNSANRKEEDLQLKDSIYKLRRTRNPLVANFLLTSDKILDDDPPPQSADPLSLPPRSHPPPLYYLPAKLTPAQEAFLTRRKQEVKDAVDKEWETFKQERTTGIEEINRLRQQAVDEETKAKSERTAMETEVDAQPPSAVDEKASSPSPPEAKDASMDVDETPAKKEEELNSNNSAAKKEESVPIQADDDEAVEY